MHPARHTTGQHCCPLSGRQVYRVRLGGFTVPTSSSFPVEEFCSSEAEAKHLFFLLCRPLCRLHAFCSLSAFPFPSFVLSIPPSSTGLFLDYYLGCELGHRLQAPQSKLNQLGYCAALEVRSWDACHRAPASRLQDKQGESLGRLPNGSTAVLTWTRLLHAKCICGRLLALSEPVAHKPPPMQSGGRSGGCSSL